MIHKHNRVTRIHLWIGREHLVMNVTPLQRKRIVDQLGSTMKNGGILNLETGYPYGTIRELMRMGHQVQFANGPYGGYQAIYRAKNGVYWGASESRKDGHAAGY